MKNPSAVSLGRLGGKAGAGIPKKYSADEIKRRTARLAQARKIKLEKRKVKE